MALCIYWNVFLATKDHLQPIGCTMTIYAHRPKIFSIYHLPVRQLGQGNSQSLCD